MAKPSNEKPMTLEHFPVRSWDKIRFADTDRLGHVNNAVFSTILETGRVEIFYHPEHPITLDETEFVIASINLNFVSEINWPGRVDVGTGITRIGNSSAGLYQEAYQDGQVVATAETVIVQMNVKTRKSHPLSAVARSFLEKQLLV